MVEAEWFLSVFAKHKVPLRAWSSNLPPSANLGFVMEKHFVIFFSPGTFVSETTKMEIPSWDIEVAKTMAKTVKERHGATPYGFYFQTWVRNDGAWNESMTAMSNMYYLGGTVLTLEDIPDTPENKILRFNMKINNYERVIENTNSWKITLPMQKDDVVLDFTM